MKDNLKVLGRLKNDKDDNENIVKISYKWSFIDNARFMASSLPNLADNLDEGIHKIKCKDCDCSFENESVKNNLINCKCLACNKNYSKKIDESLKIF